MGRSGLLATGCGSTSESAGTCWVHVRVGPCADGLYVEDDGVGIPDDERESVLEHGDSTAADGTGLGMSIVKTIEPHGWAIATGGSDAGGRGSNITGLDPRRHTAVADPAAGSVTEIR